MIFNTRAWFFQRIVLFLLLGVLASVLFFCMPVRSYADEKRYDIKFSYTYNVSGKTKTTTFFLSNVRINSDECCIKNTEIKQMMLNAGEASVVSANVIQATPDEFFSEDNRLLGVKVKKAFSGNKTLNITFDKLDLHTDIIVTCTEHNSGSDNDKGDGDGKKSHQGDHKTASWLLNPNERQQLAIVFNGNPAGITAGWQEQGELGKMAFAMAVPAGWKEAFSFDLLKDGKTDNSLKSGTMTLYVPGEYQKAGRSYAILALGRNGQVSVLPDTDTAPAAVTVNVSFEGYAMDLISKD